MKAQPGDVVVVHGHKVGETDRVGRVVEVRGPKGDPPYLVEWEGSAHQHLYFPGDDAEVRPSDSAP